VRSLFLSFPFGVLLIACTTAPSATAPTVVLPPPAPSSSLRDEEPSPAPAEPARVILPGVGFADLAPLGELTRALMVEKLGPSSEVIVHGQYTVELVYASGLHAFFCHDDPKEQIIVLTADAPMRVRTHDGIVRGVSTVNDVFRVHGEKQPSVPPEGRGFVETPGLLYEFDLLPGEAQSPFETKAMRLRKIKSMSAVLPDTGLFGCPPERNE
jgi:hypothetical protein